MSFSSLLLNHNHHQHQFAPHQCNLSSSLGFDVDNGMRMANSVASINASSSSSSMLSFVSNMVMSNALFSGGVMLGLFGIVLAYARFLVSIVWQQLVGMFIVRLDIRQGDECFVWMLQWLQTENSLRNHSGKHIEVRSVRTHQHRHGSGNNKPLLVFAQATNSIDWVRFTHKGVAHKIWVARSESGAAGPNRGMSGDSLFEPRQTISLSMIGRDSGVLRALCRSAMEEGLRPRAGTVSIFQTLGYDGWQLADPKARRQFSSVVLPRGVAPMLVKDALTFFSSEKWYAERGLPFRRGYLLEGKPGSGKSSTVFALASRLGLSICMLSLNSRHLDDATLARTFNAVPERSIVLLEDIDAAIGPRRADNDNSGGNAGNNRRRGGGNSNANGGTNVTLAGLLQALDGVASGEGRLLIMSTNCVEQLDPALIRAGRVDVRITFDYAVEEQIRRLFARFYWRATVKPASEAALSDDEFKEIDTSPVEDLDCCETAEAKPLCDAFIAALGGAAFQAPMALVQGHLLKHREGPQHAIDHAADLVKEAQLALNHAKSESDKKEKENDDSDNDSDNNKKKTAAAAATTVGVVPPTPPAGAATVKATPVESQD
jgi:chaperone BCS1